MPADSSDKSLDIIGLGLATCDILIRLQHMPGWEGTTPFERLGMDGGGPAATAVAAAARLGLRAGFVGTAGNDEMGQYKLRSLQRCGVDTSRMVIRNKNENQIVICLIRCSDGERTFWGQANLREGELGTAELDMDYLRSAPLLHLDGFNAQAALAAAAAVREAGGKIILDCHQGGRASPEIRQLIDMCDVAIGGSDFMTGLSGRGDIAAAAQWLLERGPSIVAQTQGGQGVYGATRDEFMHIPAFQVDVVDTTGAGDVFHGACIFALHRGWPLCDMLRFASAASAIVCTRLGGRRGAPTYEEVMSFLTQHNVSLKESC